MIYPSGAFEKLGFIEIKQLIKNHCLSPMGQQLVDKVQPMTNYDHINKFLRQTAEFKNILLDDETPPIRDFFDIKKLLEKVRVAGTYLVEEEVFQIYLSLSTAFSVIRYFSQRGGQYPNLEALFEHLPVEMSIVEQIERIIDAKGKMRSSASGLLQEILIRITQAERDVHKKMDQLFKNAQNNNWTADGNLTVRDGRLCIPLLAENKRKIKGFVHDESATGQTVYIEPEEVFHLNNTIRDLEFDKRREIIRILKTLTDDLRVYFPLLAAYHGFLTKLDFVRAKALFAIDIDATIPELVKEPMIQLVNARHPLLWLNFKQEKQTVVPLHILIDQQQRVVVVSGPNAGGKSVCMKTVGLLQLMVQAGLLIPASEYSKVGVFTQIFADIGDDQSIESDLSTYSAHLSKMKYFVEYANAKTLVLIDEFGTGTDPQFGGPIAEAVLESLNQKKIRGVITTHYSNLKVFASITTGLINASMLFDNLKMQPLYSLEIGKPGSSYAFEIAQKIGLPQTIVDSAKHKIGEHQKKVDTLLIDLERDQKKLLDTRADVERKEHRVKVLIDENEKLKAYLDENKKLILKNAKLEAQNIIKSANKLIENAISEIKENKADKAKTRILRQTLQQELTKNEVKEKNQELVVQSTELKVGDWVKLIDSETIGQIIELTRDNAILAIGNLRSVVKRNRIQKVSNKDIPKEIRQSTKLNWIENNLQFSPELDLRGRRGEEALAEVEKHLDRAIMMGFPSFKIIHGKGDGILRRLIRENLKKYTQVIRFEDEHADRGGDGITYVYFQ